jgi:hypothetical protein
MSLVQSFNSNLNSATAKVKSPFSSNVQNPLDGPDFPEGMLIEEILSNGQTGERVRLVGNMLPKEKLKYGGSLRMKKEFYSGYSEPSVQVFGPEESDVTINGKFKDKRYNRELKGASLEISQLVDAMRIRGNVVRVVLGEWERYALISKTDFELFKISDIDYSITFSIIGFNAPKNAVFLQRNKVYPFAINKELIDAAIGFQDTYSSIPDSVPRSIADLLEGAISSVASAFAAVTGFIDSIVTTVQDIGKAIERAKGMIKYAQTKILAYKKMVGGFKPFDSTQALTGQYNNAKFYSKSLSAAGGLLALLARLRAQLSSFTGNLPLGRHLVREGDTLQKISVKFFGTSDNWKKIYDFNGLSSTELATGRLLDIPRI